MHVLSGATTLTCSTLCVCVCVCVCVYIYIYVCVCVCVHVYTHTPRSEQFSVVAVLKTCIYGKICIILSFLSCLTTIISTLSHNMQFPQTYKTTGAYIYIYMYIYICCFIWIYLYICVCVCVCVYIYIN